jgi:hypothetical protein
MAASPSFIATPKSWRGRATVANTARDGTGTIVDIVTPGASGSIVEHVELAAEVTTTAGMLRFFLHDGATYRLIKEIPMTAVTASGSVPAWSDVWSPVGGLIVPTGWKFAFAINNAEATTAHARGGDY